MPVTYLCLMGCQNRYRIKLQKIYIVVLVYDQIKNHNVRGSHGPIPLTPYGYCVANNASLNLPPPHSANHSCRSLSGIWLSCVQ